MRPLGTHFTMRFALDVCDLVGFAPAEGDVLDRRFRDGRHQYVLVLHAVRKAKYMHVVAVTIERPHERIYWCVT